MKGYLFLMFFKLSGVKKGLSGSTIFDSFLLKTSNFVFMPSQPPRSCHVSLRSSFLPFRWIQCFLLNFTFSSSPRAPCVVTLTPIEAFNRRSLSIFLITSQVGTSHSSATAGYPPLLRHGSRGFRRTRRNSFAMRVIFLAPGPPYLEQFASVFRNVSWEECRMIKKKVEENFSQSHLQPVYFLFFQNDKTILCKKGHYLSF